MVDLVGEDDVGEHAAGTELEVALRAVPHGDAGDVGGQEVGRELDAPPRAADRTGDRLRGDVLPTPGTSSTSRWPSAKRQTSARWIARRLPRITDSICSESSSNSVLNELPRPAASVPPNATAPAGDSDPGELSGRGVACTGHVLQWGHEPAGTDSPRDGPTGAHATVPRVPPCSGRS